MRIQLHFRSLVGVYLVLSLLSGPAVCETIHCVGKTRNPTCETHTTKTSCLKAIDEDEPGHTSSCIWVASKDQRTYLYTITRGDTAMIRRQDLPAIAYQDYCAVSATMTLPPSSKGSWGAYMRFDNGPDPKIYTSSWGNATTAFATSGCTIGKGAPQRCTVTLVPPRNPPLPEALDHIDLYTEYFTSDQARIKEMRQLNGRGYLSPKKSMTALVDVKFTKCKNMPSVTKSIPTGVVDSVLFGSSPYYSGYDFPAPYVLLDYKTYLLTNVTAITWEAAVVKAISTNQNTNPIRTPLEVMVLKEIDFENWENGCGQSTECAPPKGKALAGSYCTGFKCSGYLNKLGPYAGRGYLLVSWPKVTTYASRRKISYSNPVPSRYGKELVRVKIVPKYAFASGLPKPLLEEDSILS